jgi:stage II sporulation protein AA (anti-sigma F factor antagonist)
MNITTPAPGALAVQISRDGNRVVLSLVGELDLATSELVAHALSDIKRDPPERLLLDLSELSFMDSSGLRVILALNRRCRKAGMPRLEIAPGPPAIQRVFDITGVVKWLPFVR